MLICSTLFLIKINYLLIVNKLTIKIVLIVLTVQTDIVTL